MYNLMVLVLVPSLLTPLLSSPAAASRLSLYSGVISLGVGDSIASVAGKLMGKHKWPGTVCLPHLC